MALTVTNQKPTVLDSVHTISCMGAYDPISAVKKTIVQPLLQPVQTGLPVKITDDAGTDVSGSVPAMITDCVQDTVNTTAEHEAKDLLGQTLLHYQASTSLPVGELFAAQAGAQLNLPDPSARTLYSAKNAVIPAAKELLAGLGSADQFFAALAYAYHPNTLGFWFQSAAAFDEFTSWLDTQIQTMNPATIPGKTTRNLTQFCALSLTGRLTESLVLRRTDADGNDEMSFPRLLVNQLMSYARAQANPGQQPQPGTSPVAPGAPTMGALPFTLGELFCPRTVVLVNVEAHARATPVKVGAEWQLVTGALASPVKVVSNSALSKLTSLPRAAQRAALMAAKPRMGQPGSRSASVKFRKLPPSPLNLLSDLTRVLHWMGKVNKSMNVFRRVKTSYMKANRRDPDDLNKPGKILSTHYLPDIHVYLDTSGSISESNYQESVMLLIRIAKKLNINLYFNSFSNILSQEVMLRTQNKSIAQIWQEFRRIPKVTGGTDYLQIWQYINASATRKRRLSLVITDFDWTPPATRQEHPSNLYYAPCSGMNWTYMLHYAREFTDGMQHIDPSIRQKLIGMIA